MFTETYRPTKVSDVILTSDVQQLITNIKNKKTIPNMIFMGTGMEMLTIENFILYKEEQPEQLKTDYSSEYELD